MGENYQLSKWLSGEMTGAELKAFQAEPDFVIYEKIKIHSLKLEVSAFNEQSILLNIVSTPKKNIKTISIAQSWIFKIAATLIIALGLFFIYRNLETSTFYANNGTQNTFFLPDHSQVILNSGSEIRYKKWNWNDNRTLNLNGEAYFKVAKGKTFEVNTSLGQVTVLGTHFNVKQRGKRFEVTCYEGRVKINYYNTERIINKGERVAFEDERSIETPEILEQSPEWLNREMVFNKADLESIIREFERHFDISIELKGIDNGQLFTGSIPGKNISAALEILSLSYHLQPVKVNKNKIILNVIDAQK